MSYYQYEQTRLYGDAMEYAKKPGQKFCNDVGWKLTQSKYTVIQRPDNPIMIRGTIYRTITPTKHVWYRHNTSGEHIWIEFDNRIIVKRGIAVTITEGTGFGKQCLHPNPDNYRYYRIFYNNDDACKYLLSI